MTDPRLQQAADLIRDVLTDVDTARTNGAVIDADTMLRLAVAHDAISQADALLGGTG